MDPPEGKFFQFLLYITRTQNPDFLPEAGDRKIHVISTLCFCKIVDLTENFLFFRKKCDRVLVLIPTL